MQCICLEISQGNWLRSSVPASNISGIGINLTVSALTSRIKSSQETAVLHTKVRGRFPYKPYKSLDKMSQMLTEPDVSRHSSPLLGRLFLISYFPEVMHSQWALNPEATCVHRKDWEHHYRAYNWAYVKKFEQKLRVRKVTFGNVTSLLLKKKEGRNKKDNFKCLKIESVPTSKYKYKWKATIG